ncbi:SNF2-related protein [Oerskovia sp. M15]
MTLRLEPRLPVDGARARRRRGPPRRPGGLRLAGHRRRARTHGGTSLDALWASARTDPPPRKRSARSWCGSAQARGRGPARRAARPARPRSLVLAPTDVRELLTEGAAALGAAASGSSGRRASRDRCGRSPSSRRPRSRAASPGAPGAAACPGGAPGRTSRATPMTLTHELTLDGVRLTAAEREHLASVHAGALRRRAAAGTLGPRGPRRGEGRDAPRRRARLGARRRLRRPHGRGRVGDQDLVVAPTPGSTASAPSWRIPPGARRRRPEGLHASLRDYQVDGLRWLAHLTGLGLGACLADDMGLGKTITLIALHLHRARTLPDDGAASPAERPDPGPTLVVCPASLLGNWEQEIRKFAPGIAVRRFHGASRDLRGAADGFVLTTYGTVLSDSSRAAPVLGGHRWGCSSPTRPST